MKRPDGARVLAVLAAQGWPQEQVEAVSASLVGQVSRIEVLAGDSGCHVLPAGSDEFVLVLAAPVISARGAVERLQRAADDRSAVVRVLLPGGAATDVALWSTGWLHHSGLGLAQLADLDLAADRARLPHQDPHARVWVRADDVGLARFGDVPADHARWARAEGIRLLTGEAVATGRGWLGRVRRALSLRQQRRGGSATPRQRVR